MTIDGSFFMVVPGYASIERDVTRRALSEFEDIKGSPSNAQELESLRASAADELSVSNYVSPSNFEIILRGMFYRRSRLKPASEGPQGDRTPHRSSCRADAT
ncbi:MAG: hypothetical protein R3F39_18045 [Myxococcota bacterium]